jgi:cysteine desulfurase
MKSPIYFDYAAATPLDEQVFSSMQPYFAEHFYNPSGMSLCSQLVARAIEGARTSIARNIGATSGEIIFTAGGTEANNLVINGVMAGNNDAKVLFSSIEHDSVILPAMEHNFATINVSKKGRFDLEDFKQKLDDSCTLISCIYANNEIGTIQPIRDIAEIVKTVRLDRKKRGVKNPIYFHTDACQAALHLDVNVSRLGVDFMTINGGKIYGPKQSGALYIRSGIRLSPLVLGGGQEHGLRSGTENVTSIIGLSSAFEKTRRLANSEKARLTQLRDVAIDKLSKIDGTIAFHGDLKKRLPNHISFAIPGVDNERLIMVLEENGIIVASGSACHASNGKPSTVLGAIGVPEDIARATIRLTMGRETTKEEIEKFLIILKAILPDVIRLS